MRKVIVSMNVTLDGFMSGPNCELDWHFQSWTKEMSDSLCDQLSKADTILLGRVTYGAMAKYWPSKARDLSFPREDVAFADMMNNYPKLVFSKTLTTLDPLQPVSGGQSFWQSRVGRSAYPMEKWNNSRLVKGNIAEEVVKLKRRPGKNMIIYGSGEVVAALMQLHLIDEYQLWVHPVILGRGKPLFKALHDKLTMTLFKIKTFSSGVVILYYESNR